MSSNLTNSSFIWYSPTFPCGSQKCPCSEFQTNFEDISPVRTPQQSPTSGISQLVAASTYLDRVTSGTHPPIVALKPTISTENEMITTDPGPIPLQDISSHDALSDVTYHLSDGIRASFDIQKVPALTTVPGPLSHLDNLVQRQQQTVSTRPSNLFRPISKMKEKQYSCWICHKEFGTKGNLKTHTMTHTGEKPFSCFVCGKRFTQKGNVETHMKVHTGQRNNQCDLCGKGFSQKGNLKQHMRSVHMRNKPYACNVCERKFTQKVNLKAHHRVHYTGGRLPCSICGRTFIHKGSLKTHIKGHTEMLAIEQYVQRHQLDQSSLLQAHSQNILASSLPAPADHSYYDNTTQEMVPIGTTAHF